ncbi:MAG: UDP-N-acetylglucosamine 1-carboxyvinyltransferase [Oscillospiraceae bacterium]|nr:UDP-N-acetylglucosamine 1-carboxyvinyltransferase [Oscillospiraceae bacterium]
MKKIVISGGNRLEGRVKISGAKNAAVAILPAAILSEGVSVIENIPDISDISLMCEILSQIGARVRFLGKHEVEIDSKDVCEHKVDFDNMRKMRASCYLLGSLLGRFGRACVSMPGGCDFGVRPIDQHIKGFSALGAKCEVSGGVISAECIKLKGANIYFDVSSVGATVNVMLAAVKSEGCTVIENAAKEPHVVDLANFLNSMGADVCGAGTDEIKIKGVKHLNGTSYSIIPDQIEAGTFLAATLACGGDVTVDNVITKHLEPITAKLEEIGAKIETYDDSVRLVFDGSLNRCNVKTMPYPGFPTDMQPQITAVLLRAKGTSIVSESVWDHRFRYISELIRMGASASVDGRVAIIEGVDELSGTNVKSVDLRAGASLIIAGLSSKGMTVVENASCVERGYENITGKLASLGADIRISEFKDNRSVSAG